MITQRDARRLSVDELRALVRVAGNTAETWNQAVDAQGLLDMYHAAEDAGWDGWEAFVLEDASVAVQAWERITASFKERGK